MREKIESQFRLTEEPGNLRHLHREFLGKENANAGNLGEKVEKQKGSLCCSITKKVSEWDLTKSQNVHREAEF